MSIYMWRLLVTLAPVVCATAQTLAITSAALPALAGQYSVAPGSLIVVIPSGSSSELPGKDLSAIRLEMQPTGSTQVLPMTAVALDSGTVWVVVPPNAPLGLTAVTMTVNHSSMTGQVYLTRSSFALFSMLRDGSGPALAQNIADGATPVVNQLASPALPGQYVTLWGTGLGDFTTPDVSLEIYGTVVQPSFAGHAPGLPGLDQINFQVPASVPGGCYIPLTVTVAGDDFSNKGTIATAALPGTVCIHPLGLSAEQLKKLDQGGTVVFGTLGTMSTAYPDSTSHGFQRNERMQLWFVAAESQRVFTGSLIPPLAPPGCSLGSVLTFGVPVNPYSNPIVYSDAGPSITFSGPDQRNLTILKTSGVYSTSISPPTAAPSLAALTPPFIAGGLWTVSGPGGVDLPAFQQTFTVPPPLRWTNRDALTTIDRNADLVITWDSQGDVPTEIVTVDLLTSSPNNKFPDGLSAGVHCSAAANAGRLVIPRDWLQKIVSTLPGFESQLGVNVSSDLSRPTLFNVPLKTVGTAPVSAFRSSAESISVVIQ